MKTYTPFFAAAWLLAAALFAVSPSIRAAEVSDVFFSDTFDRSAASIAQRWTGATVATAPGHIGTTADTALKIHNVNAASTYLRAALPAEVKGRRLIVRGRVKGDETSKRPMSYHGLKLSLAYSMPGQTEHAYAGQAVVPEDPFDWRMVCFSAEIPADAISVWIRVGLEGVSGTAWFDDLSVEADPVALQESVSGTTAEITSRWSGLGETDIVGRDGGLAFKLSNDNAGGARTIQRTLPADIVNRLKGRRLILSGEVKAENVSARPNPYNGIKVMLAYTSASNGGAQWPQATIESQATPNALDTFGWRHVHTVINLPHDATSVRLVIGLERVTGTAWFDNLQLTVNPVQYGDDFNDAGVTSRWALQTGANWGLVPRGTGQAVRISNSAASPGTLITRDLDPVILRGQLVNLRALVKATEVGDKPPGRDYNGIKIMVSYRTSSDQEEWPQIALGTGTFDWTVFQTPILFPDNIISARLTLGLERVSGTVDFDDIELRLENGRPYWVNPTPGHTGHDSTLRGVMVRTNLNSADVFKLESWGVNLVRWQLGELTYHNGLLAPNFDNILCQEVAKLDAILPALSDAKIAVVLDLHSLSEGLFHDAAAQQRLISAWRRLAAHYRNNPTIWSYDIANEPDQDPWKENLLNWNELAQRVSLAIREVDPVKTIVVESIKGEPSTFRQLRPIETNGVMYSFHYYRPWTYVAQGLDFSVAAPNIPYPSEIDGIHWDQERIIASLQAVIDFQNRHDASIYVGEFSVIRWAPGGAAYLEHCVDIFDANNWHWSYHAFREWQGWSLEIDGQTPRHLDTPAVVPTDRLIILQRSFSENIPFGL